MQQSANILFQLALKHSFFKDGLVKGMDLVPTTSGAAQLARIQAHCHRYRGGLVAVSPQAATAQATTVSPVIKGSNVVFSMEISDLDFLNYTDLQEVGKGMVLYGNNLGDPKRAVQLRQLQLRSPQWSLDLGKLLPTPLDGQRVLKISRPNGEVVMERSYVTSPRDTVCQVDLLGQTDGAYTAAYTASGKTIELQFFKWDAGLRHSVLGFFEWFGMQAGKNAPATPLGQQWTLQFDARKTYWQYYLVLRNGTSLRNPSISPVTVGRETVRFAQTNDDVVLPNGSHALEFTSDAVLPLQESPKMTILLEATGLAKGMQLPYASPELLYAAATPTARSSKIYVYF